MEVSAASQSVLHYKPSTPSLVHPKASLLASSSHQINLVTHLHSFKITARQQHRNNHLGTLIIHASSQPQGPSSTSTETIWLLQPIGDGDSSHIGYKVELPNAFEITSSDVTVGRVPEKADMVIPVATVSGLHARIQKKGIRLYVTDLKSTNGTYIDEIPLKPGVPTVAPPGSTIIFGDMNLAMFRVSKIKKVEVVASESEPEEDLEDKVEAVTAASGESSES